MTDTKKLVIELTIMFCLIGILFSIPGSERYLGLRSYHKLHEIPHKYVEEVYIMEYEKYSPDNYVYIVHTFYDEDENIIEQWDDNEEKGTGEPRLWFKDVCTFDDYGYAVSGQAYVYPYTGDDGMCDADYTYSWSEDRKTMIEVDNIRGYKEVITFYDDGSKRSSYDWYRGPESAYFYEQGEEYGIPNVGTHMNSEAFFW